jgi:hypothetical protein
MFPAMIMLMLDDSEGCRAAAGGGADDFVAKSAKTCGALREPSGALFRGEG